LRRLSLLLVAVALSGCVSTLPGVTPAVAPPSATLVETGTATPSLTATARLEASWTATATHTATPTPTVDWGATPTPIAMTPGIIEVSPIGGQPTYSVGNKFTDISGEYQPFALQNIRTCPEVSTGCGVVGQLSGAVTVQAYGLVVVYPQIDVWICIDAPPAPYISSYCSRVVALVIGGKEFGSLVLY